MSIASPGTLLLAAVLASPTFYQALTGGDVSVTDAAIRYLICVPVAAIMLMVLRAVTRDFGKDRRHAARRTSDHAAEGDVVEADRK